MGRLVRDFHFSLEYVIEVLPLAQGFALLAWNCEANPWVKLERVGPGYIGQDGDRLKPGHRTNK